MTNAWPWWEKSKATVFPARNSWLNFRVRGPFKIKILIVRHINTTYFIWILKKIKLKPAMIWKLVTCQRITSKKTEPRRVGNWARDTVRWYWTADTLFWQLSIDHNIDVQYECNISLLARKCEIQHWLPCGAQGRAVYSHVITKFSGMGRINI